MKPNNQNISDLFGEIISSYSRADAIDDGVLIDVTETAKEAGFCYPVAITRNLWHSWLVPSDNVKSIGQDLEGRLWDVLWMLNVAIKRQNQEPAISIIRLSFKMVPALKRITISLYFGQFVALGTMPNL